MSNSETNIPRLQTPRNENPFATRWVFFPGDVLSVAFKKDHPHFHKDGGIEVQAVTLAHSNGFIRRGRFTPMVHWAEGEIAEHANKNGRHPALNDVIPVAPPEGGETKSFHTRSALLGVGRAPRSEMSQVLNVNYKGTRYGVTEITPLFDVEPEQFGETGYPDLFFSGQYDTPAFPRKLSELRKLIKSARGTGDKFHTTKMELLASCDQFEVFGKTYLEAQNNLVRQPPTEQGFVFTYSQLADVLFEQIEYERVDTYLNKQARQGTDVATALDKLASIQEQLIKGNTNAPDDKVVAMMQAQLDEQRKQLEANQKQMLEMQAQLSASVATGGKFQQGQQRR